MVKMKAPCEVIVWDVLPGIRAALAEELVREGVSQKEASELLGITPAAISQYIAKKRGYKIEFQDAVKAEIKKLATEVRQGRVENVVPRICAICMKLREEGTVCGLDTCGRTADGDLCRTPSGSER